MSAADDFLDLACLTYQGNDSPARRAEALQLLESEPAMVATHGHVAAAVGDAGALRALLAADPTLAVTEGGPRAWVPLLYLCYSRVHPERPGWDPLEAARVLLAAGADPNRATTITGCRFSAVTGAIGVGEGGIVAQPPHRQASALVGLLLDAGASCNDSQALYNTHFLPDDTWLRLFIDRGLTAAARANWDETSRTTIFEYLLGQAAHQGFGERVALLLEHGANPDGRNHYDRRTHLESALLNGHDEIARQLRARGAAPPQLTDEEQFRVACLAGDEAAARRLLAAHPTARDQPGTLCAAALRGHLHAVRLALDLGLPVDGAGPDGLTPLHHAAQSGHVAVARELVARGAPLDARDRVHGGRPVDHAEHFQGSWPTPGRLETLEYLRAVTKPTGLP